MLDPGDAEPYVASFSTLQRVEIAEILRLERSVRSDRRFQYSSTSRNCRNRCRRRLR